ncbi:MAG: hypothetical protein LBR79_05765 [Oscillospiraceae bacterium]|nr:hypothetical protein [Oscillospiraceae bacterium]
MIISFPPRRFASEKEEVPTILKHYRFFKGVIVKAFRNSDILFFPPCVRLRKNASNTTFLILISIINISLYPLLFPRACGESKSNTHRIFN